MPKGHMTPCLALLTLILVLDVLLIVGPFYLFRFTDDPWGSPERMGFIARGMASALAFGLVAAIAAERRNHSPWMFLLGHAGFIVTLAAAALGLDRDWPRAASIGSVVTGFAGAVAALLLTSRPKPRLELPGALLRSICRTMHALGNIWFGMVLMTAIAVLLWHGIDVENEFGTKAAQYLVYRSWWFGTIFFTGGVSMLCATFRKYPFRLEQAGWLTVHTGLALVVIGSLMSFISSSEGELRLKEGESREEFTLSTQTRVIVEEFIRRAKGQPVRQTVFQAVADFDINPTEREPNRKYLVDPKNGDAPFTLVVDRYFANSRGREVWTDDGSEPLLGVELSLTMRGGAKDRIRLDESENSEVELPFGGGNGFPISLRSGTSQALAALARKDAHVGHGQILIYDDTDKQVLAIPVEPSASPRADGQPAPIRGGGRISGTEIDVQVRNYFDNWSLGEDGRTEVDVTPGQTINPTVSIAFSGPKGEDAQRVFAFFPAPRPAERNPAVPDKRKYGYYARYDFTPQLPIEGPHLYLVGVRDRVHWVYVPAAGERSSGPLVEGEPLPLPMPAFQLTPAGIFHKLKVDRFFEFLDTHVDDQSVRIRVEGGAGSPATPPQAWLRLGQAAIFEHGDREYILSWKPTSKKLGFSLKLNDFHRDFYPGSTEERTFESYCELRHPEKFKDGADIKIDMNHPLRLDGWRLFQARFARDGETTFLQVNRDPGLAIIYPACAVVFLGLIVVFFMKPTLRLIRIDLERRNAGHAAHLWQAARALAAVAAGPVVFGTYAALQGLKPEWNLPLHGWPAFVFGMTLLIAAPIAAVYYYLGPVRRRLEKPSNHSGVA